MDVRESFIDTCRARLSIDKETLDLAYKIHDRCRTAIADNCGLGGQTGVQDEETRNVWFACILFIAKGLRPVAAKPAASSPTPLTTVTVSQILDAFDVSLSEFQKELPVAIKRAEPNLALLFGDDPPLERRLCLREFQTSYIYTTVLAKKCKDTFRTYFDLPTGAGLLGSDDTRAFRLCWLMFVVGKARLLPPQPDLVTSFSLLVCVLNVFLANVPPQHRLVHLQDTARFPMRVEGGVVDSLHSLAVSTKANWAEVKPMMAALDALLKETLAEVLPDANERCPEPGLLTHCTYFRGLLTNGEVLEAAITAFSNEYEKIYTAAGEIDERGFALNQPELPPTPLLAPPPSLSKCHVGTPTRANGTGMFARGMLPSPMRQPGQQLKTPSPVRHRSALPFYQQGTPVTEAMNANAWLRDTALHTPDNPSPQLQRFFEACSGDVAGAIAQRVEQLSEAVFPDAGGPAGPGTFLQANVSRERRREGIKLYYRVLEAMLVAEEARTGQCAFTPLLTSNSFHKCLLACAFELVVASYKMVALSFPAVLERLQLKPFDMAKLIDPFILHEPTLPAELRRHLLAIEERIVEHLAWERNSSLYPLLIAACSTAPAPASAAAPHPAAAPDGAAGTSPSSGSPPRPSSGSPSSGSGGVPGTAPELGRGSGDGGSPPSGSGQQLPTTPTKRSRDGTPAGTPEKTDRNGDAGASSMATDDGDSESPAKAPRTESASSPQRPARPPQLAMPSPVRPPPPPLPLAPLQIGSPRGPSGPGAGAGGLGGALLSPQRSGHPSAFTAFVSPLRRPASAEFPAPFPRTALPASFGPVPDPLAPSPRPASTARNIVADLLRKVLKLAAARLDELCARIDFKPLHRGEVVAQVFSLVQWIVYERTSLLYNRHLDQVLLCAVYGLCKVRQLKQISFKEIISHYRLQPQAKPNTFRTVVIDQTDPDLQVRRTGDVIEFYNSTFIPVVKPFLLQFSDAGQAKKQPSGPLPGPAATGVPNQAPSDAPHLPGAAAPQQQPPNQALGGIHGAGATGLGLQRPGSGNMPMMSPVRPKQAELPMAGFQTPPPANRAKLALDMRSPGRQVSATKKIFVSPLRASPQPMPGGFAATPRTRSLYATVGEPLHAYASPSKDLDFINSRINGFLARTQAAQGAASDTSTSGGEPSLSSQASGSLGHSTRSSSEPSSFSDRATGTIFGADLGLGRHSRRLQVGGLHSMRAGESGEVSGGLARHGSGSPPAPGHPNPAADVPASAKAATVAST